MRLAIVHDASVAIGGAERVVSACREAFPDATVFAVDPGPQGADERPSFLRHIPGWLRRRKIHVPLLPIAAETFDLSEFDAVLSLSSTVAKGVVTRPGTVHICYLHTPTRFVWDATHEAIAHTPAHSLRRGLLRLALHQFRLWDAAAARRVDLFLVNSKTTQARVEKYYRRSSVILHPPVSLQPEKPPLPMSARTHFLFVGRLTPSKQWRLAVDACYKLDLPLVVVGEGPDSAAVRKRMRGGIRAVGRVSDAALSELYRTARAVLFPSDDDFGIVPIEALAHGTPVVALRRGGATETIEEGVTGEFFSEPDEEFLADGLRRFLAREHQYDPHRLQTAALPYSTEHFQTELQHIVGDAVRQWQERRQAARQGLSDVPEKVHPVRNQP